MRVGWSGCWEGHFGFSQCAGGSRGGFGRVGGRVGQDTGEDKGAEAVVGVAGGDEFEGDGLTDL